MKQMLFRSLLGAIFAVQAFALPPIQVQVDQALPRGEFQLGVGSLLTMNVPGPDGSRGSNDSGLFLGKLIQPNGDFAKFMFLDIEQKRVYLADQANVEIGRYSFQPVLKQYDQIGGTCTGYAIDHFLQQMYWSGFEGIGTLKQELSTEKGRTQLLVDSIHEYYLVLQHQYSLIGVMKKFGKRFGFLCEKKMFRAVENAIEYFQEKLSHGQPVMVSFMTGTEMYQAPFKTFDYERMGVKIDSRLWIPRKRGEREDGGHSVVMAASFEADGRPYLVMLDSDWSEPRIWDVEKYFDARTAIDEVEFITCK